MKVDIKETVEYYIVLSGEEAIWLKGLMQNPVVEDETAQDTGMRLNFWNALDQAGVKQ